MTILLPTLAGAIIILLIALIGLIVKVRSLQRCICMSKEERIRINALYHQVDDLLTSIRWHIEMLSGSEAGRVSIAQQQSLANIASSTAEAAMLLSSIASKISKP